MDTTGHLEGVRRSRKRTFVKLLCGLPLYALAVFYLYVIAWRLHLGFWPEYGRPDAGVLHGFTLFVDACVFLLLAAAYLSCFVFGPAGVASLAWSRLSWLRRPAALWACGWSILLLMLIEDPGGFFAWFID